MPDAPAARVAVRRILELLRKDRAEAARALGALPVAEQARVVCEAPLARRAELLDLAPRPEELVPALPEAELCFVVKSIGVTDAWWVLAHATPEQVIACLDLDAWHGLEPDRSALDEWMAALAEVGGDAAVRALREIDPELLVLFLKGRIDVVQKPNDDEGWSPPEGFQTLEGQFHFGARAEGDDLGDVNRLLRELFERDYWLYFRVMQGVVWELDSDNEHWALRWRSGRLEDLGFPPWEEAMAIYGFLRPEARAALPAEARALDVEAWRLPVYVPPLPADADSRHLLFRALAELSEEERRGAFYAFVALANKVAVADRMTLSDAESTPAAIEKAARLASEGLAHVAEAQGLPAAEVLRRVPFDRLFRVGANLDPEAAKPRA